MTSEQAEDYLKNIYKLQEVGGKVTTTSLSERLGVSPPSVTEMLKKLAVEGMVTYMPYKGVELSAEGRRHALKIIRRHRLWELFLSEVFRYSWDEIDKEAERLEHITSEQLEQRIDEALKHPSRDPHGHVIPTAEGEIDEVARCCLADVKSGATVVVAWVSDLNPEVLQCALKLGLVPKRRIRIKERVSSDGSLRVEVGRKEQFVSFGVAQNIFVEMA